MRLLWMLVMIALAGANPPTPGNPTGPPELPSAFRDRRAFAAALATVRAGMTERQVIRVLGPPGDVRTQTDPGGIPATGTSKVLRYGAARHLACATLGQVYLNGAGAVQYVFGGKGTPPAPDVIQELELARLLPLIHEVRSYDSSYAHHPLSLIRAVNALRAAGRPKALAALGEYLRISSPLDDGGRDGVFLVLRTAFDVAGDVVEFPRMLVGAPAPPEPRDRRTEPRFPIVMADDIPVLAVTGYFLAGLPEPPARHLLWFREHGTLSPLPLRPPDHPLATLDRLLAEHGRDPARASLFVNQFLSLLESVHRAEPGPDGLRFSPGADFDSAWRALRARLAGLRIRWDPASARYVFADGSVLPSPARRP